MTELPFDRMLKQSLVKWSGAGLLEAGKVVVPPLPAETLGFLATVRSSGGPDDLFPVSRRALVSIIDELIALRALIKNVACYVPEEADEYEEVQDAAARD